MLILIFCIVTIVLFIPAAFFLLEVFLGIVRLKDPFSHDSQQAGIRSVILVPAHNEESVITSTLENLLSVADEQDHIVVIADNCNDQTAQLARQYAHQVLERTDENNRGKGFALAYGLSSITDLSPDVVIVVDADCEVAKNAILKLKQAAHTLQRPVQASYLLYAPEAASAKQRVSAFAIYVKNILRPLGLNLIGGSVPITGSGFAAPYASLKDVDLASGEIVEDMKLGIDLALQDQPCHFLHEAHIRSPLPGGQTSSNTQRERWEHGHLGVMSRYMPMLFIQSLLKRRPALFFTALDMSILPLTLLVAVNVVVLIFNLLIFAWAGMAFPMLLASLNLVMVFTGLFLANKYAGESALKRGDLQAIFQFALSKVGIYTSLLKGKRSGWVKTKRDKD